MRFATFTQPSGIAAAAGIPLARAGVVSDAGIHPLPPNEGVLNLVRAGLPAALTSRPARARRAGRAAGDVRLLPPLAAPTIRNFVAFEEHVGGHAGGVWRRSGTRRRRSTSLTRTR